ncbi:MAG: haloalkane dehalogenase, partial [Acidimicrobiia bacterium]
LLPVDAISPANPFDYRMVEVLQVPMAYIDTGSGKHNFVLLHGNPTSSYLWRNVIPHLESSGRCLVPDLPGFGRSGSMPSGTYRFAEYIEFLEAWLAAVLPAGPVTLVLHDWGAALGFDWARRHPERVQGLCYGEAMVQPRRITDLPRAYRDRFIYMRTDKGFREAVADNYFINSVFTNGIIRELSGEELAEYSGRFTTAEAIVPTVQFPREIAFDGEPADNHRLIQAYADWLSTTSVPKLFVNTTAGHALIGRNREFCRTWPNQREMTVVGKHYYQEDSPHELGRAIADWASTLT